MNFKYIALALIICALYGCKKDTPITKSKSDTTTTSNHTGTTKPVGPQYLVVGNTTTATSSSVATLWRNGKAIYLADSTVQSQATAIALIDTDVYIVGVVNDVDTIWKNGVATPLSGGDMANGLAISGNDVYVVGDSHINNLDIGTVWKNGTPTYLTDQNTEAFPSGIAVNGTDVYVAGNIYNGGGFFTLTLWKNGVAGTVAANCVSQFAPSVTGTIKMALLNNDVYITGAVESQAGDQLVATLWKNGTPQALTDGSKSAALNDVTVSGGKIYTAGYYDSIASYWTGASPTYISPINQQYMATAITVYGGHVYAAGYAGYSSTNAAIWKGNSPMLLSNKPSIATGIAIFEY